ncbi:tRNA 2-thiocytidine biosynthesis TtcA family protein [Fusibacter sp. 3D3]|uniref:tRNA 2-thiocytidine biosynthesis TtcA family protein n=1 Tax=Fusibacter sp. 3D3 TaxID=1048380 RepID=UPI0008536C68|nr:tRNA 2-thiocytidine biosynthesis TtcA family protein [Fusibacter sp. 3D3]GAU79439.1 tRNA(Cytosine32)-2-thiocytidine synthetase [Fusibacter sp. 3D3]
MKRWMQTLFLKPIRYAIDTYNLIEPGDRILVGVSGGKDSSLLFFALGLLKKFNIYDFELTGYMVDHGMLEGIEPHQDFYKNMGLSIIVHEEPFVFLSNDVSPCYTCSRMRKGIMRKYALNNGYNKIAFGHTKDDVVETFMMNLIKQGRIAAIPPVVRDETSHLKIIRPLVFLDETSIVNAIHTLEVPIVASKCEHAKTKIRERSEKMISIIEAEFPEYSSQVIKALSNIDLERTLVKLEEQ